MLTAEQQFVPIAGGWGRTGMTHIRLAAAKEDVLAGALRAAWKLRIDKNAKSGKKTRVLAKDVRDGKSFRKRQ